MSRCRDKHPRARALWFLALAAVRNQAMPTKKEVAGEWSGAAHTIGGCPKGGNINWRNNPQYALIPSKTARFEVTIAQKPGSSMLPIGLMVLYGEDGQPLGHPLRGDMIVKDGKSKFKASAMQKVTLTLEARRYIIMPSTYEPGMEGAYTLEVVSDDDAAFVLEPHNGPGAAVAAPGLAPMRAAPVLGQKAAVTRSAAAAAAGTGEALARARQLLQQQRANPPANVKPSDAGRFSDVDFECRIPTGSAKGDFTSNPRVLYISGSAPKSAKKVDNWVRLEALGGAEHDPGAFSVPTSGLGGSQFVLRDGLADTWLAAAVGMVCTRPDLVQQLLQHSEAGAGLHALRLFKDGAWTSVAVDDLVPCHGRSVKAQQPAYSSSEQPGAGPLSLVQKALAKLYGCYEQLNTGRVGWALEDLTGGVSDCIYLRDGVASAFDGTLKQPQLQAIQEITEGTMYTRLAGLLEQGHLAGATYKHKYAAEGEAPAMACEGETPAHLVYPLLECKQLEDGGQFVRLRNPYAKMPDGKAAPEWRGAWGNAAADWQDNPGVATQLGGRPRDGSFWMEFNDFYRGFNKVHVCRLAPAPAWQVQRVAGEWTAETAGGDLNSFPGSRWRTNPQYRLRVSQDTNAVIAVSQPDAQLDKNEASDSYPHEVGFYVFHEAAAEGGAAPPRRKLVVQEGELAASPRLACTRQTCQEMYLQAGVEYTVMPCTKDAYVTMAYTLTVATAAGAGATLLELSPEPSLSLRGAWSDRSSPSTAGGCPNNPDTWTLNPQFLLTVSAPTTLTGVLCLELDAARAATMRDEQAQYTAEAANVRAAGGDEQQAAAYEQHANAMAPAIGWLLMRSDTARQHGQKTPLARSPPMHAASPTTAPLRRPTRWLRAAPWGREECPRPRWLPSTGCGRRSGACWPTVADVASPLARPGGDGWAHPRRVRPGAAGGQRAVSERHAGGRGRGRAGRGHVHAHPEHLRGGARGALRAVALPLDAQRAAGDAARRRAGRQRRRGPAGRRAAAGANGAAAERQRQEPDGAACGQV